jgi:hypothetical protein
MRGKRIGRRFSALVYPVIMKRGRNRRTIIRKNPAAPFGLAFAMPGVFAPVPHRIIIVAPERQRSSLSAGNRGDWWAHKDSNLGPAD